MSRVAKAPVALPKGVEVTLNGQNLQVKGSKGALALTLHDLVEAKQEGEQLVFAPRENTQAGWMQTGTARALASNYVKGVSVGFERKLQLVGVGYKAAAKGKVLNLDIDPKSHPAWTGGNTQLMDRGGRVSRFKDKFGGIFKK